MGRLDLSSTFLRTRVARRVLLLFVTSALVPTVALSFVSYRHVSGQLMDAAGVRLEQASKTAGMEILQHLQAIRNDLDRTAAAVVLGGAAAEGARSLEHRTNGVGRSRGPAFELLAGEMRPPAALPEAQLRHVATGRVALVVDTVTGAPRILLVRRVDPDGDGAGLLWAEVSPQYLWGREGAGALLTESQDLCVFDSAMLPLVCTRPLSPAAIRNAATGRSGTFEWSIPSGDFIGGHFTMFLGFDYGAPSWSIVLSESRGAVLAPLADFRRSFLAVVLLALGVVFVLSQVQIRRVLTPLDELTRATDRLTAQDFSRPVHVSGRDEFSQLGTSFNAMARQLQGQFAAMRSMHEFDRAALAAAAREGVAAAVPAAALGTVGCRTGSLALADHDNPAVFRVASLDGDGADRDEVTLPSSALALLAGAEGPLLVGPGDRRLEVLLGAQASGHTLVQVLRHGDRVSAALLLGMDGPTVEPSRIAAARQLADQVTLALSRVHLVEDLEALNRGTLTALARAIDANSRWTAGHSERVSTVARSIGRAMGLSHEDFELLTRGALLHDVGKIGVPAALLNKPGPLTPEEFDVMRSHTTLGVEILTPIAAYQDLMPLVRSHHEMLDGSGYPDGLSGDAIPQLVRILTIADIFDALVSERPYRPAWPVVQAVSLLRHGAGVKFDPHAVEAFLRVLGTGDRELWDAYPALATQLYGVPEAADEQLLSGVWK